jgi:hypothetical protein
MASLRACAAVLWMTAASARADGDAMPRHVAVGPSVATWGGVIVNRQPVQNDSATYAEGVVAVGLAVEWFPAIEAGTRWRSPRWIAGLEVERWLETKSGAGGDVWAPRLRVGGGVGPVTLGASIATGIDGCGDTSCGLFVFVGPLVEVHVTSRWFVLDVFARVDWETHPRREHPAAEPTVLALGIRGVFAP